MPVGHGGQSFVAGIAEKPPGALTELARGIAGQGAVEGVELGEEPDIGIGKAPPEGLCGGSAAIMEATGTPLLLDQAGDLGAGTDR
ncbi:MAG: hypothetical protein U5K56_07000 [Halioglobus sp.]|nr:hypothetical protein [Halioglobus sp.]